MYQCQPGEKQNRSIRIEFTSSVSIKKMEWLLFRFNLRMSTCRSVSRFICLKHIIYLQIFIRYPNFLVFLKLWEIFKGSISLFFLKILIWKAGEAIKYCPIRSFYLNFGAKKMKHNFSYCSLVFRGYVCSNRWSIPGSRARCILHPSGKRSLTIIYIAPHGRIGFKPGISLNVLYAISDTL